MQRWMIAGAALALACRGAPPAQPDPTPIDRRPVTADQPAAPLPVAPPELGDDVAPAAYRLELEIDPAAAGYRGAIEIDVTLAKATRAIWLHASPDLTVTPVAVTQGDQSIAIAGLVRGAGDIAGVALGENLRPGTATLRFEIAATYRDRDGLFAQEMTGERFVYTDFEPVDARRAFPCFDLPRWRAPWTITVRAPDGVGAYANTAETSQTREGDLVVHRFATTAPLPTYLVAVAVGRFTVVDVPDAPIPARILVPGLAAGVELAASLVGPVLDTAARTIGRAIPWPKLDLVVVPMMSGAMENPGLVTVAWRIAVAPRGPDARRLLALVIAHEVAHLWFGDAVTVPAWRELWLNEGLASWLADRTLAAMQPPWRDSIERVADRLEVFADDDVAGMHALRPAQIGAPRELFDRLSYDKGAAVIHLLDAWLGTEPVRAALADHLDRHAWSSASSEELIASLAAIDGAQPIAAVVTDAIAIPGVPEIAAEVDCAADRATLVVRVVGVPRRVVVCARWSEGRGCAVAGATPAPIALGARCPAWVTPDDDGVGYYRWQLPARWWTALAAAPLTAPELQSAIEAAMAAAAAGQLAPGGAAAVVARAIEGGDRRLLEPAARAARLLVAVAPRDQRAGVVKTIAAAAARALVKLGRAPIVNDDPDRARARAVALELAGVIGGDRKVVRWADKAAAAWLRGAAQADQVTAPALAIAAARGKPKRQRALVAAIPRTRASDTDAAALGRALAALPDATLEPVLESSALPRTLRAALIGALLEDPGRAPRMVARLGKQAPMLAVFATAWPCGLPAIDVRTPDPDLTASITRQVARLTAIAARCQALVTRYPPP